MCLSCLWNGKESPQRLLIDVRQQPVWTVVHWSRQQPKESFVDEIWWLLHQWNSCPNDCCDFSNCCHTFIHEHPPLDFKCTCLIFMCVVVFCSYIQGLTVELVLFQWEIFQAHQDLNVAESHAEHKAERSCPPQEVPCVHCNHRLAQYHVQFLWVYFKLTIQYRIFSD